MGKNCTRCGKEKDIIGFSKKYKTKDGIQKYSSICKTCFNENDKIRRLEGSYVIEKSEYDKSYYEEKKPVILKKKKDYHIKNREDILKKKEKYRKENKEKIKGYIFNNKDRFRENQKKYRKNNPHVVAWRRLLHRTLKYLGTKKEGLTSDMLGYSALELKNHIENGFKDGMDWSNYGEWHIDHIYPLTSFDKCVDVSEVNSLSNLQPLWKEENLKKSNKIINF